MFWLKVGYLVHGYANLRIKFGRLNDYPYFMEFQCKINLFRELCNFFQYWFTMVPRKLISETYKNDTLELIKDLKKYLNYEDFN